MSRFATIEVDEFLPYPAERVWAALTRRDLIAAWMVPNDFELRVGHRFSLDMQNWGVTSCEVLAFEPGVMLQYSWRNGPLDTVVTWRLVEEGTGTRLLLEHRGFDLDHPVGRFAHENMRGGWRSHVFAALDATLQRVWA